MNNLSSLKKILNPKKDKYHIGTVIARKKGIRTVELENSAKRKVWGTSDIGKTVIILKDQIIGEIGTETMSIVSID